MARNASRSTDRDLGGITVPPAFAGISGPAEVDLSDPDAPDEGEMVDGVLKIEIDDGSVTIDLNPQPKPKPGTTGQFDSNLALTMSDGDLSIIASRLLEDIQQDDQSRQEWLDDRANGISLLGLKIESSKADSGSAAPLEGMSTVRHPLLLENVIRFQSTAAAELQPAWGPVKVRNDATPRPPDVTAPGNGSPLDQAGLGHNGGPPIDDGEDSDELAEALEKDFNYYLTSVDRGYRADFDRMLFWVGFGGCGFRKIYNDPIKRMPLSRSVDAKDLIVNNAECDFDDCRRITHRIKMRSSQIKRMQLAGVYRDVKLQTPTASFDAVEVKIAELSGFSMTNLQSDEIDHTIYECYCELDLPGYQHKDDDDLPTGLELPYRVTMDKDTRVVLEIRRNWREDDENCLAKKTFVKYPFVPAFGFYEIGLLQILGNATKALTGVWREALDSGMFANFPGFLYADVGGRQVTNEFRVPPGGGQKIQTGGKNIQQVVMPLPYKEMGPGFMSFAEQVETTAQRVGGTADIQAGEGKQEAPVGTTLALIEQAKVVLSAVHVRLHAAQCEEFQLLKERFLEDPTALWRRNKRPAHAWTAEQFIEALNAYDLVPSADPNNPSHLQRIMKAQAIKQLQQMNPNLYLPAAVDRHVMTMLGINDIEHLFNPNPPPPPDPNGGDPSKMAAVQLKQQQMQQEAQQSQAELAAKSAGQKQQSDARMAELQVESQDRESDRQSREKVAQMREDTERVKVAGELAQHQQASGDATLGAQTDTIQHFHPSGDATAAAQAGLAQHHTPSADAFLGAQTTMAQHQQPSADQQMSAAAAPPAPPPPLPTLPGNE